MDLTKSLHAAGIGTYAGKLTRLLQDALEKPTRQIVIVNDGDLDWLLARREKLVNNFLPFGDRSDPTKLPEA